MSKAAPDFAHEGETHTQGASKELRRELTELREKLAEQERINRRLSFDLTERCKELACHKGISLLLDQAEPGEEEFFSGLVELIPPAFQYPDRTSALLMVDGREFRSGNYEESCAALKVPLKVRDLDRGFLKVCCSLKEGETGETIFLEEERDLLKSLAQSIVGFINKNQGQSDLREKELLHRTILDASPDMIILTDLAGNIIFASPKTCEEYGGGDKTRLKGRSIFELIDPAQHERVGDNISHMYEGEKIGATAYRALRADGSVYDIEVNGELILDEEGRSRKMLFMVRDISERKKMEHKLWTTEALFKRMVESVNDVLYEVGSDGTIKYVSPAVKRILGYEPEEVTGKSFFEYMYPEDRPDLALALKELGHEDYSYLEYRYIKKNGKIRWVRSSTIPVYQEGIVVGGMGSLTDIHDRKMAELSLRKSEYRFRKLFENMAQGVIYQDPSLRVTEVNPAVEKIFAMGFDELRKQFPDFPGWKLVREDGSDLPPEEYPPAEALRSGRSVRNRLVGFLTPGAEEYIWLLMDAEPEFREGEEKPYQVVTTATDISRRKEIQQRLADQKNYTDSLIKAIPDMIFVLSNDGIILEYRSGNEEDLAMAPENFLTKHLTEIMKDAIASEFLQAIGELLDGKTIDPVRYEMVVGGEAHHYEARLSRFGEDKIIALISDISRRVLMEEELQEYMERVERQRTAAVDLILDPSMFVGGGEESFRQVNEVAAKALCVANVGIWIFSEDFQTLTCLTEYDADKKHHSRGSVLRREDIPRYFEALMREKMIFVDNALTDPRTSELAGFYLEPYGISSMLDAGIILDGSLAGVVCIEHRGPERRWTSDEKAFAGTIASLVAQVLTARERRLAEMKLQQSEKQYRRIVETTHEGVWLLDCEDRTVYVNSRMAEMLGSTPEEMAGHSFFEYIEEKDLPEVKAYFERRHKGTPELYEITFSRKNGASLITLVNSTPILDGDGNYEGTLKMVADISDRKRAEEERIARQAAEEANRAKSAFLSNMSHEIRTPLNAIIGFSQILQRDANLTSKQQEQIGTITRSGDHLLNLINAILDISKIEAGHVGLSPKDFGLHRLLEDVEAIFSLSAADKGLQLIFDRHESVPEYAHADEHKLRQVLINLIGNAVKFTEKGGVAARFRCDSGPGRLTLKAEIEDSGPGIPGEVMDHIFESFQQADAGRKSGGTGLGLAISRSLVRLMGGDIRLESRMGEGSIFRFDLPIRDAEGEVKDENILPMENVIGLEPGTGPVRVLLVDDRQDNLDLLKAMLEPVGFELMEARDGKEALEVFSLQHPHCVLMDLRMPVMDGYEATRRLKSSPSSESVPILAITASAFEDDERAVHRAGFDGYIRKPFRTKKVFAELARLLDIRYIYEKEEVNKESGKIHLEKADLAMLPEDLLSSLRDTVEYGNMIEFKKLLVDVEACDARAARGLGFLASRYDYEKLMKLLQKE